MKTKLILLIAIIFLSMATYGQKVDMERMERDLEVAKNVMQSLMGQGNNYYMWSKNIEASYLEGYGVIFTLPNDFTYWYGSGGVVVSGEKKGNVINITEAEDKAETGGMEKTKQAVTTFLIDYSDLIGQLDPSEKIMVHAKSREDFLINIVGEGNNSWSVQEEGNANFSAETSKENISDYKQGKISREEAINRIEFTEASPEEKVQDLELFASIIRRLYSPDLSKTFFTNREPRYERLKGFGVIFYMSTYSSYENDRLYSMPVLGRDDVDENERKETIKKLFPKFEDDLKEAMVEYGRTIKSLEEDEVILMKVKTTKCSECGIPESLELSVKKSVLTQFDQRKIALEEAKKSVKVQ